MESSLGRNERMKAQSPGKRLTVNAGGCQRQSRKCKKNLVQARCEAARQDGRHLDLHRCRLNVNDMKDVVDCLETGSIESIDLSYCGWYSRGDDVVAELLEILGASLRQITKKVKMLNLSYNTLGNYAISKILGSLTNASENGLEELYVRGLQFGHDEHSNAILGVVDQFPGIRVLDFAGCRGLGDHQISILEEKLNVKCEKSVLREVNFSSCFRDQEAARIIQTLIHQPCLETIVLSRNFLGNSSEISMMELFKKSRSLRTLKFDFIGNLLSSRSFASSLAASSVQVLELSLVIAAPKSMRRVLSALPESKSLRILSIDGVALPEVARVVHRFTSLETLVIKGAFVWTPVIQRGFYHNRSLQKCITTCQQSDQNDDLDALTKRNQAITRWHQANQSQRAAILSELWPRFLSNRPLQSSLNASCCLDLLRRGVVEA